MKKIYSAILLSSALTGLALPAYAYKLIEAQDNQTYYVDASAKDTNRITIENGRLRKVMGKTADFIMEKDDKTGQFLARFRDDKKTSSLVVIAEDGRTYTLVMKPIDIPAESFVLRDESVQRKPKLSETGKKDNLEKSVRDLMLFMAGSNSRTVSNRVYQDDKQNLEELGLWKDTKFFIVSSFVSGNLVGDKYRLYNVGDKPITVAEQEFYQKGVVAVSVQSHVLDAGRDTFVYVVKLGDTE